MTAHVNVNVYDGTRQLIDPSAKNLLIRIAHQETEIAAQFTNSASTAFTLPFQDNFEDTYSIIASADSYRQAGFTPVQALNNTWVPLDLMLIPNNAQFNFAAAQWTQLPAELPQVFALLSAGVDPQTAQTRYNTRLEDQPASLACFFNLTTAMAAIALPQGTPLDYLKELNWDDTFAQDRFFAWGDPALLTQVELAARQGTFAPVSAALHPGATSSYKQIQFGEANVQLTFHADDHKIVNGLDCILIEPDIDYYKDPAAHLLLEVAVNALTGSLTDPKEVYVLRWIAGRHAEVPDFNPPYTITG